MPDHKTSTGVCIIRAVCGVASEMRLTVIVNHDVEHVSKEMAQECRDRVAVLALVAKFLDRCERQGPQYVENNQ